MEFVLDSIRAHPAISTLVAVLLFNNGITSLPTPTHKSSQFYLWFFRFTHLCLLNVKRIIATRTNGKLNEILEGEAPRP